MAALAEGDRGGRFPLLQGILPITYANVLADVIAGATLAALAIPEVMGYTKMKSLDTHFL